MASNLAVLRYTTTGRMFALSGLVPYAPHRMNQMLCQRSCANAHDRSRHARVAGTIEARLLVMRPELPARAEGHNAAWGPEFSDRVPAPLRKVAAHVGGPVIGRGMAPRFFTHRT